MWVEKETIGYSHFFVSKKKAGEIDKQTRRIRVKQIMSNFHYFGYYRVKLNYHYYKSLFFVHLMIYTGEHDFCNINKKYFIRGLLEKK